MCKEDTLQAYVDGELEPAERDAMVEHLAVCERCRGQAAVAARRRDRVGSLIAALGSDGAADLDHARSALARFHARVSAQPTRAGLRGLAPRTWATTGALITAAICIAATLYVISGARPPAASRRAAFPAAPQAPVQTAPDAAPIRAQVSIPSAVERPARPSVRRTVRRATPAGRYVLISNDVRPPDMGMVVRMQLPLSVLARGSGDADGNGMFGEILADVLVGQDGRPYAIRLVSRTR
jgi:anti-sigma factor RsiW